MTSLSARARSPTRPRITPKKSEKNTIPVMFEPLIMLICAVHDIEVLYRTLYCTRKHLHPLILLCIICILVIIINNILWSISTRLTGLFVITASSAHLPLAHVDCDAGVLSDCGRCGARAVGANGQRCADLHDLSLVRRGGHVSGLRLLQQSLKDVRREEVAAHTTHYCTFSSITATVCIDLAAHQRRIVE